MGGWVGGWMGGKKNPTATRTTQVIPRILAFGCRLQQQLELFLGLWLSAADKNINSTTVD